MSSEVEAEIQNKNDSAQQQEQEIDLYIGVFFDGTNNNKYQVMLGKMFRRQKIFNRVKERLVEEGIISPNQITEKPRSFWEEGKGAMILTSSEIDYLYFGYGNINDNSSNEYNTFIEKKSTLALDNNENNPDSISLTSRPDLKKHNDKLQSLANQIANKSNVDSSKYKEWEGTASQNATYTNVAIMESLYKCENKKDDEGEINERHISIYVEGSGTDMQLGMDNDKVHILTYLLAGLALGTGPTGVVAKVRKASMMINRLLQEQLNATKTVTIKLHFDVFGFSRGATTARIFTYLVNPNPDIETKSYVDYNSIIHHTDDLELFTRSTSEFLKINDEKGGLPKIHSKEIRNLGIFDTVSSIGVRDNGVISNFFTKKIVDFLDDTIDPIDLHVKDTAKGIIKDKVKEKLYSIIKKILGMSSGNLIDVVQTLSSLAQKSIKFHLTSKTLVDKLHGDPIEELKDFFSSLSLNPYHREDIEETVKWKKTAIGLIEDVRRIIEFGKPVDKNTGDISVNPKRPYHHQNIDDYGLWTTCLAKRVFHICAMDEIRQNFALVDICSSIGDNGTEIFIPGCHTDIGGGAAIEKEEEAVINKKQWLYFKEKRFPRFSLHDKRVFEENDEASFVADIDTLKRLGWCDRVTIEKTRTGRAKNPSEDYTNIATDNFTKMVLHRHVKPGYSNISLHLMIEKCGGQIFNEIPSSYQIPAELNRFYDYVKKNIREKKRCFIYPKDEREYRLLRRDYLHLSMNDRLNAAADNIFVNGPEFCPVFLKDGSKKRKILLASRIIYEGSPESEANIALNGNEIFHMFDFCEKESVEPMISGIRKLSDVSTASVPSTIEEYNSRKDSINLLFNSSKTNHQGMQCVNDSDEIWL